MKKILLLFILLLFKFISFGQQYEMLVDTNKLWSNVFEGSSPPFGFYHNYVKFKGDTTIGLYSYKKVFQADNDSTQTLWYLVGGIREDSSHKVYYYSNWFNTEGLFYDFGASVGDTISVGVNYTIDLIVDSIDSVFIFDRFRKRLYLDSYWSGEEWIEGIGSNCGIMESGRYCIVGGLDRLLCYYENDTLKYINPDYGVCYLSTANVNEISTENILISVFPNPFTFATTLQILKPMKSATLIIYDILGKEIKRMEHLFGREIIIQRERMRSGMYFYSLSDKTGIVGKGKMIME